MTPHELLSALFVVSLMLATTQGSVLGKTINGLVRGFEISDGTQFFLGIPFATPPLVGLRWQPPQPLKGTWDGVRDAVSYGPACVQPPNPFLPSTTTISEDCLTLDIYVPPSSSSTKKLPVMIWIYGGAFFTGWSGIYNASSLIQSERDSAIVVAINYRLGPFGFLALPQLKNQDPAFMTTGNYGIQDQRMAMLWVKENIASFGGDPHDITLFGESAGAISICFHLAAPLSQGLFNAAILESGWCEAIGLQTAFSMGQVLVSELQCNNNTHSQDGSLLECLRAKSAAQIVNTSSLLWWPVVDGTELIDQPLTLIEKDGLNVSAIMLGTIENEYAVFVCDSYTNFTAVTYQQTVWNFYGKELGNQVLRLYPVSAYSNPLEAYIAMMSERVFKCPTMSLANVAWLQGVPKIFMYSFEDVPGFASSSCYGAAHGFELPFLFPSVVAIYSPGYNMSEGEQSLSEFMRPSWIRFATTRSPNTERNEWPDYVAYASPYIRLNLNISVGKDFLNERCMFWAAHPCSFNAPHCG